VEVVTYWIRIGEHLANDPWAMRWTIFSDGIRGRVPDGLLVRTSSLTESAERAEQELALQHTFLADLYQDVPDETRRFLVGGPQVVL
jgi:EpsI family protein